MTTRKKTAAGRVAALLATLGLLVLSSGVALMVTATSANAEAGPKPCTEGTGWIEVSVSGTTYTYNAPADKLISEVCAKGPDAHPLFFAGPFDPPVASYSFDAADYGWLNDNDQVQDISHIGVKLVDVPEEEPPVEEPPVEEPPVEEPPTTVVEPPTTVVEPPTTKTKTKSTVITPTVVNAGLGELTGDVRAEQGLALVFAGMVLVMAAGGLGLVRISGRI